MSSVDRFAEAEADVDTGSPWLYRETDVPNPLTIEASGWSTGFTKLGEAEFLNGTDRDGKRWSILVGSVVLTKRLIEGLVEEWDSERGEFVVVDRIGRVEPGEIVSVKYVGDVEGAKFTYPSFRVSRKPPIVRWETREPDEDVPAAGTHSAGSANDDIPFA